MTKGYDSQVYFIYSQCRRHIEPAQEEGIACTWTIVRISLGLPTNYIVHSISHSPSQKGRLFSTLLRPSELERVGFIFYPHYYHLNCSLNDRLSG